MKAQELQRASTPPSPLELAESFVGQEARMLAELSEIHDLVKRVELMLDRQNAEIARLRAENKQLREGK